MTKIVLDTTFTLKRAYESLLCMKQHDYDMDEILSNVIDALQDETVYPTSIRQYYYHKHQRDCLYDEQEIKIINDTYTLLYHDLYLAIKDAGVYEMAGTTPFSFDRLDDDVVILLE